MTDLVAMLSVGKGTWGHVSRLINEDSWDNIFLITNDFGKENFKPETDKKYELIVIEQRQPILDKVTAMKNALKDKLKGTEVALNLVSGDGKEHMALLSALMQCGVGFRLVALTKEGVKEI